MKVLKNRKTGAVFAYNKQSMKLNSDLIAIDLDAPVVTSVQSVVVDGEQEPNVQDADKQSFDSQPIMIGDVPLDKATKAQLVEFAQSAFGHKFGARDTLPQMRETIKVLIEA